MGLNDGKPLYAFKPKKSGDAMGDGFKGVWHIATPKGRASGCGLVRGQITIILKHG